MVAVAAEFAWWNGFERLLYGMHEYKCHFHDYSLVLTFVGKGGDEGVYRELVNKFGLANEVEFISYLSKVELNELYLYADIGISTLAAYRKGIDCVSPLKTAEYCACGLPIVSAYRELRFPNDCYFLLNVPNDSAPINMTDII